MNFILLIYLLNYLFITWACLPGNLWTWVSAPSRFMINIESGSILINHASNTVEFQIILMQMELI